MSISIGAASQSLYRDAALDGESTQAHTRFVCDNAFCEVLFVIGTITLRYSIIDFTLILILVLTCSCSFITLLALPLHTHLVARARSRHATTRLGTRYFRQAGRPRCPVHSGSPDTRYARCVHSPHHRRMTLLRYVTKAKGLLTVSCRVHSPWQPIKKHSRGVY
jgi:hypothetical protein